MDDETKLYCFLKFEYATILDCFISEFEGCAMTKNMLPSTTVLWFTKYLVSNPYRPYIYEDLICVKTMNNENDKI